MSVLICVKKELLESEYDMDTLCPKKLFVYCENEGINRINGNITQAYQKAKKNGRRTQKNVSENEWEFIEEDEWEEFINKGYFTIKGYFIRFYGWSMDVN